MAWNSIQMKQENLSVLRAILLKEHCATKSQLAKMSGLSVVTVTSLLRELQAQKEVMPDEELLSIGGRPAVQYRYNAQYKMALIGYMYVHEGKEQLFLEVQDLFQTTLNSYSYKLETLHMEELEAQVAKLLERYPSVSVMVFGIPGTAHEGKIKIIDYPFFQSQNFFERLQHRYQIPVLLENDINAALYGYCFQQQYVEECVAGVYLPKKYPPGSAIYIRGDIYRGANHMAGELGQLPLPVDWTKENLSEQELLSQLEMLIQTITCMVDPHALLLYCEYLPQTVLRKLLSVMRTRWKILQPPHIILRSHIHEDFSLGIKAIASRTLYDQIICK